MRGRLAAGVLVAALAASPSARAVDLPQVGSQPLRLDVTNVTIGAQRFDARTQEGNPFGDHGYGYVLDRLNLALVWGKVTAGTRLDTAVYWRRPAERGVADPSLQRQLTQDGTTRFRDAIYPAKLWVTYSAPGVEATVGDAYVQFGRGLVLSMRKIDDLGIDTTLRGVKVAVQKDPFGVTAVAGYANPSRIDEATGRSLFLARPLPNDPRGPQPLFGSDRIVGGEIQAGRGTPVILSTHAVRLTRCAPYRYDAQGRVVDQGLLGSELGSCESGSSAQWLDSLPLSVGPTAPASEVVMLGQSVELPRLGPYGSLYVGAATQSRKANVAGPEKTPSGNALYASYAGTIGAVTNTLEIKSYRNFFPLGAAVEASRAAAFSTVLYSQPPTAEVITQDSAFGFFNACVDGGRLRTDVRLSDAFMVYAQGIYAYSRTEVIGGGCDAAGRTRGSGHADEVHNRVLDALGGVQWDFDRNRSYLYAWAGGRDDRHPSGASFYAEQYVQYTFSKWVGGAYSVELLGRHRRRFEDTQNLRGPGNTPEPWVEGENYTALKIAPKWILSHGFEYTTRLGFPTYYNNASVLWRFTTDSNVRVYVGQQRGGLRCVSGVCRVFPAFEGARVELTLRF